MKKGFVMKQILRVLLFSSLLSAVAVIAENTSNPIFKVSQGGCCAGCCLGACDGSPFLLPRSQGFDAVRDAVGIDQFNNIKDMESPYGTFAITPGYTRSMKPDNIAQFFFGDQLEGCNKLLIQGSNVATRHPKAWVADYFGLPSDYSSAVKFSPVIDNFMVDLNFYVGLDDFWKGTYFKIHSPLTHTRWNMNMTECIKNKGTADFPAGLMSNITTLRTTLPTSLMQVMQGATTFGDMKSPICYGKFPICTKDQTRLADVQATFGWNIFGSEDYNIGVIVDAVLPTGTRPSACYLFEPMIGNGKHFELGAGVLASWIFYRSEQHQDRYLGLWFDAKFNHLFASCQKRSFDFCGKPNSRYMLLEEFGPANALLNGGANHTPATYEYTGNMLPAINYTTFNVDAKINCQTDMVFKFGYVRENWNFDFGYNFWARTGEKFACPKCTPCVDEKKYALKGNAWLYGDANSITENLSNTNGDATIQNVSTQDNPVSGYYDILTTNYQITHVGSTSTPYLNISLPPVFVTRADLNMGATPTAISHKLFLNIEHAWKGQDVRWLPFLGIGGSVEIAQGANNDCTCSCDCNQGCGSCGSCCGDFKEKSGAISQWGSWVKAGVYFE